MHTGQQQLQEEAKALSVVARQCIAAYLMFNPAVKLPRCMHGSQSANKPPKLLAQSGYAPGCCMAVPSEMRLTVSPPYMLPSAEDTHADGAERL